MQRSTSFEINDTSRDSGRRYRIIYPNQEEAQAAEKFRRRYAGGDTDGYSAWHRKKFGRDWAHWSIRFPEVAAEADGWDPLTASIKDRRRLTCKKCGLSRVLCIRDRIKGNFNIAEITTSVPCTGCSGKSIWPGINDLLTRFPEVARHAKFDASKVTFAAKKNKTFSCNRCNGTFSAQVCNIVAIGYDGFNDRPCCKILSKNVDNNHAKFLKRVRIIESKLKKAGIDISRDGARELIEKAVVAGVKHAQYAPLIVGLTDLKTRCPEIAAEAHEWAPSTVTKGSREERLWKCQNGHVYTMRVAHRTCVLKRIGKPSGCKACSLNGVTLGVNDFLTKQPALASLILGVDPSTIGEYHRKRVAWNWPCGHKDKMSPHHRVRHNVGPSRVCPNCLGGGGFKGDRPGFFYFLKRPGQTQFGITFSVKQRMKVHARFGWNLVESFGSLFGEDVRKLETDVKQALRAKGIPTGDDAFRDPFPGRTESFQDVDLEASSVCEMLVKLGIPIPEFVAVNQKPVNRNTRKSK